MATPDKKRKVWDKMNMKLAVEAVKSNKMGYLKASRMYNVPRTTLFRFCQADDELNIDCPLGRKTLLGNELENILVQFIKQMEKWHFGLIRNDVKRMAYQLAVRNRLKHSFNNRQAGRKWLKGFFRRHEDVTCQPAKTLFARANGFTKDNVMRFFNFLEKEFEHNHYPPNKIFNVGQTGLSIQSKILKVSVAKEKHRSGVLTSDKKKSLMMTLCLCMSAAGDFVPPLIIFPRKRMNILLMKGAPAGSIGRCHLSGCIQADTFLDWFKHFIRYANPTKEDPVLLILDSRYNYFRNIHFINLARESFINVLSLPPHSTHKMQPLDITIMSNLKSYYSEKVHQRLLNNGPLTPYEVVKLFGKAYSKIQNAELAMNGFMATGIFPPNRYIFKDDDYSTEHNKYNAHRTTMPQEAILGIKHVSSHTQCSVIPIRKEDIPVEKLITPEEIATDPQLKRIQSVNNRKRIIKRKISGSSYKTELELGINILKLQQQQMISVSQPSTSGYQQNKNPMVADTSSPNSDIISLSSDSSDSINIVSQVNNPNAGAECIYCCGIFYYDKQEDWHQCIVCRKWVHDQCLEAEFLDFVCDFCMHG